MMMVITNSFVITIIKIITEEKLHKGLKDRLVEAFQDISIYYLPKIYLYRFIQRQYIFAWMFFLHTSK